MKKIKLLAIGLSILMLSPAVPANSMDMAGSPPDVMAKNTPPLQDPEIEKARKEEQELIFKNRKSEMLLRNKNMLLQLQKEKPCIEAAESMQALLQCNSMSRARPPEMVPSNRGTSIKSPTMDPGVNKESMLPPPGGEKPTAPSQKE